ncbi:unnamed protein product, partial [Heterotrigona itama]
ISHRRVEKESDEFIVYGLVTRYGPRINCQCKELTSCHALISHRRVEKESDEFIVYGLVTRYGPQISCQRKGLTSREFLLPKLSVPAEQSSSARYAEAGVAVAPERAPPSRGGREVGRDDATTSDERDDGGRSSHGGHPVDLDVPHRTVAVSANHFLPVDDRRLRGDALQPVLRYRTVRPLPADPPDYEEDHAEDRDDREDPEAEVERRQLKQYRAVGQGLVVPRWTKWLTGGSYPHFSDRYPFHCVESVATTTPTLYFTDTCPTKFPRVQSWGKAERRNSSWLCAECVAPFSNKILQIESYWLSNETERSVTTFSMGPSVGPLCRYPGGLATTLFLGFST